MLNGGDDNFLVDLLRWVLSHACSLEHVTPVILDLIEKAAIEVSHILSAQVGADGFTITLDTVKFGEFRDLIGIENCE